MATASAAPVHHFYFDPDPEDPTWLLRRAERTGRYIDVYGSVRARIESKTLIRLRYEVGPEHANLLDAVHGGHLLAIIDQAIFMGPFLLGVERALGGVTVDVSAQFLAPAKTDRPVEAVVELLKETGRMFFVRGTLEQDDRVTTAYSGTLRKSS